MKSENATVLNQRYLLTSILGKGGQATVYSAKDQFLNVERAIKVLSPQGMQEQVSRERFQVEAQAMAKVEHPGIVKIYDVVQSNDHFFIVMELIKGGTLWDWVKKYGKMPERMAAEAILKVVDALIAVHRSGIIHRDVKPHNMLLNEEGAVKITDFGIARGDKSFTQTGLVFGTFGYMAPEQIENSKDVTTRSDIFSVGACLYALCKGKSPKTISLIHHKPSLLEGFSEEMKRIILKATQEEPTERYNTAVEMHRELSSLLEHLPEIPDDVCLLTEHARTVSMEHKRPVAQQNLKTIKKVSNATFLHETVLSTTQMTSVPTLIEAVSPQTSTNKWRIGSLIFAVLVIVLASVWWSEIMSPDRNSVIEQTPEVTEKSTLQTAKVCLSWAQILAKQQRSDGGFSGILQVDSSPWDTGQQLTALKFSERCGFSAPMVEKKAIARLKQWFTGEDPNYRIYDFAWPLIYLSHKDATVAQLAAESLMNFRLENGAYKGHVDDTVANIYATVLAAWALGQKSENKPLLSTTVQYLQQLSFVDLPVALDEQLWWVLHDIGTRFPDLKPTTEHTLGVAQRIVERCDIAQETCSVLAWPDGKINLRQVDKDAALLELQGAPWIVAAASALRNASLPKDTLDKVNIVFNWAVESRLQASPYVSSAPGYKLSENLLTISLIVDGVVEQQE